MSLTKGGATRSVLTWVALVALLCSPVIAAVQSPLLAWRDPIYIAAGFAGIIGLALLLLQPLLIAGQLPGLPAINGRRAHRWIGSALVLAVVVHVAGLWLTSPPDVLDALLFTSPTPFAPWGVTAMWAVFAAAGLALARRTLRLSPRVWRRGHTALVAIIVVGTVVHTVLIEGTMETLTKFVLCVCVVLASVKVIYDLKIWSR